jgi:hypothetical protein
MRRHAACGAVLVFSLVLAGSSAAGSSRAPHNRSLPKVGGQPSAGKTLSAGRGRWSNRPTTFRYAWQTCNAAGRACRIVSGAKKRKFTLRARDVGHRMRVVVVAVNRAGRGAARSKPTAQVTAANNAGPPPPLPPPPPGGPPPPPAPPGSVRMTEDLGWAPVPSVSLPWNDINQLILFNLATQNGPGLDMDNIQNINVPTWVATVHAHPGIKAIIAIGGAGNNNWPTACNDTNRAQFVQNFIGFATSNGFDGIDLDIEDEYFFSHGPPNAVMTACVNALADAGHAAGLFVSADVITNWGGEWWAASAGKIDQFNLMTFGSDLPTMQDDVQHTIQQGLPPAKFVVGIDVSEHPQPPGGCAQFSDWADQAGLLGAFVWEAHADYQRGNICANQIKG